MNVMPVYRISVFVPAEYAQRLIDGICAVDDLRCGNYDRVLWTSAIGTEQFRPLAGAHPALGKVGEVTQVSCVRIELCIARDETRLRRVIEQGIRAHHPWQTPAIFVDESQLPLA